LKPGCDEIAIEYTSVCLQTI